MEFGIVKYFDFAAGYGLIAPEDGGLEVCVHASVVEQSGHLRLPAGSRVRFERRKDESGTLWAENVQFA
jgi:cold shock protein